MPRNRGWFRVYDRAIDSPQVLDLTFAERGLLFSIWCLASAGNGVIPYSPAQLRRRLCADEWSLQEFVQVLSRFELAELLEECEDGFTPVHWAQHQYDKPSDSPEAAAERKRRSRDRKSLPILIDDSHADVTRMSRGCHAGVTPQNRIEESSLDESRGEGENTARDARDTSLAHSVLATPPSADTVSAPVGAADPAVHSPDLSISEFQSSLASQGAGAAPAALATPGGRLYGGFEPPDQNLVYRWFCARGREECWERFYWHYQSIGWVSGKNPVVDWTALAQKWLANENQRIIDSAPQKMPRAPDPAEIERQRRLTEDRERAEAAAAERLAFALSLDPPTDTQGELTRATG